MKIWFRHHVAAICHALAQFRRSPGHFFFNILVLSMTLALPFGGMTILDNIQSITEQLSVSPEISIFLKQEISRDRTIAWNNPSIKYCEPTIKKLKSSSFPKKRPSNHFRKKQE